ncbi:hypothetical protein [uncultured Phenylobacterium sp.]|uniref:hypothetical protein n=1 Tax=uncultured Phenylobacterium sp. TaxID=349273 RepID=UPI0025FC9B86|nr:hypothetical protein [uncultured Phenylobacterium sp.]
MEGNFLLTAGQVRAMPDLRLLPPASKADSDVAMGLYGVIYFQAGGPGDDDVLRQVASRARFFDLFDRWTPAYSPAYDPGWRGRRRPSEAAYRTAIAEVKASRRRQLADAATMYADATYSDLNRRHKDLQRRNPQGFVEGTPNAKAARDLRDLMHQRALALGLETVATPRPEKATAGPDAALRFPPATPEASEVRVSGPDPVVERCADLAETMTIASESRIVRVLVTRSARWGAIWRADLQSKRGPMERLTCTSISTSSRPRVMGSESLAPLPE